MQRKDWNLLVISAAGVVPLTPVQLQKILFLIGQNLKEEVGKDYYSFLPYNYGPFDLDVYLDAETLQSEGYALVQSSPNRITTYTATALGLKKAEELAKKLKPEVNDYINSLTKWAQSLTFQQLVSWIYAKYPRYKENSIFRG